jgi:hypothetical protein
MDLSPAEVALVRNYRLKKGIVNPYREYSLEQLEYMSEHDIVDYGIDYPDQP